MGNNGRAILDLRGLAIRAYKSAHPEDSILNEKGERVPTAASGVKCFINRYLSPILERFSPIDIIGVLEGPNGNARRRTLLTEYKNRPEDDAADKVQKAQKDECFNLIQKLLLALGCTLVKTPYAEADDTIAYLCKRLKGSKTVHTVDNDLLQLHAHDVALIVDGNYKVEYKGMNFEEGVDPSMVILYKSIVGDTTDGYPGVRGMGEKAWAELVEIYGYDGLSQLQDCVRTGNYEPIVDSLKSFPEKTLRKLYEGREQWRNSYLLAVLHPEWCETTFAQKYVRPQWAKRVPTRERLEKVLVPLGLESYISRFKRYMVSKQGIDSKTNVSWERMYSIMGRSPLVAFDYESYDSLKHPDYQKARDGYVDVLNQKITGVSFAFGDNLQYCFYLPVRHRDTNNWPVEKVLEILQAIDTDNQSAEIVAHNGMFEGCLTQTNLNYKFNRPLLDTRVMCSYVDENEPDGLKHCSKSYLNYDQTSYNDVVKPGEDMRDISLEEVLDYGCDDSICTAHLAVLFRLVMECEQTWDFYVENEPYFDAEMLKSFIRGVNIDFEELERQIQDDTASRTKLMKELRSILEKNCKEVNQQGFETLWADIQAYEKTLLTEKALAAGETPDQEAIDEKLEKSRQACYNACKYNPLTPMQASSAKALFSTVSKHLGFPGIRSTKDDWMSKFAKGIREQAESQGYEFSSLQNTFLSLMEASNALDLYDFCSSVVENDEDLWEGDELNIGSPKQMGQLFYGKLGLPILLRNIDKNKVKPNKRTCWDLEQSPSTDILAIESWMAELGEADWRFRVLEIVKALRAIKTKFGLYYKPYPLLKSPIDGRLHPSMKNCGTVTRRPSCSTPNLLQLSKKDEAKFRRVVVSDSFKADYEDLKSGAVEEHVIVSIDFVQQELVVLAGLSDDANLRACYQGDNRKDVHSLTGTSIVNLDRNKAGLKSLTYAEFEKLRKDKSSKEFRVRSKSAKTTNFLMVYGGSEAGLSRKATVPRETASQWVEAFFSTYPKVKTYQERMIELVRRHGFIKTCFGNRRHLPAAFDSNKAIASAAERQGINSPIQGGCADLLKKVFRQLVLRKVTDRLGAYIIAPVYDEIIASVPISKVFNWCEELSDIMEVQLPGLNIGLETSVSVGINAGDQIELGTRPNAETVRQLADEMEKEAEKEEDEKKRSILVKRDLLLRVLDRGKK